MINREIIFERNITGSFMKIPASIDAEFDEKVLLKKRIPGILPFEKNYINGQAQYWYNISGKQSLDLYCRVHELDLDTIEKLTIAICNQIEILEWNLLDVNSLVLDMELIYISSDSREFIFTVYPGAQGDIRRDLRQLMEIIITKVNHKDMKAVHSAYAIYEKTMDEAISFAQIRDDVEAARTEMVKENVAPKKQDYVAVQQEPVYAQTPAPTEKKLKERPGIVEKIRDYFLEKWSDLLKRIGIQREKEDTREKKIARMDPPRVQTVVYDRTMEPVLQDYPTVLLSEEMNRPRGVLIYDGVDGLSNIVISKDILHVGKGNAVDIEIERDTISRFHAKIEHDKDNHYYIQDLNSKNGTFVNHEMIAYKERRQLKKNDIVAFADIQYRFS